MQVKSSSTLRRGGGSSKRNQRAFNPAHVYDYSLRCAIRACLEQTKVKETKREHSLHRHSVHINNMTDRLGNLADRIVGDENEKSNKLTKPVVVGLMRRLEEIKDGKDVSKPEYVDRRFISVIRHVRDTVKQHRYRPQGSINDLVVTFLKTSEAELKKSDPNPAVWFKDLDRYVVRFTEILLIVLREDAPNAASSEYIDSLQKSILPKQTKPAEHRKSHLAVDPLDVVENFPMVKTVQNLFQIESSVHRQKIRDLLPVCTESNYLLDLKQCINAINTNQSFPGRREDFASQPAYDSWVAREKKYLNGLMTVMVMNPHLSITNKEQDFNLLTANGRRPVEPNRRTSMYVEESYTFIPNDPRACFRLLMNMCMDLDTNIAPDAEKAKTSILSQASDDLLRECSNIWRLSAPFRSVLYLELIKIRMDTEEMDIYDAFDDAREAIRALDKCLKENEIQNWTMNDRESLVRVFEDVNHTCLHALAESLERYWDVDPVLVKNQVCLLESIYENPAYLEVHPDPFKQFVLLEDTIAGAAVSRWRVLEKSVLNPENDDMTNLMKLADKLIKELVTVAKRFKKSLKGYLHAAGIVMTRQMPFFVLEMENWAFLPSARQAPIELTFELYDKVLTLKRLYDQYGPKQKSALFKVESWFLTHVRRWLASTHEATPEWVSNAIKQDQYRHINENTLHSSSVVDLFTMFHQAVEFVQNLEWPNGLQECRFNTALSKVIGVALEQYTMEMEDMITLDIYPRVARERDESGNFFDRARHQLIGGRPLSKSTSSLEVPADFFVQTCVKFNNIEAARSKLDRLYQSMDVDEVAQMMREYGSQLTAAEKPEEQNYLYSIKIVRAENLPPSDNNGLSDPYIVLEIENKPITRTKTVYETLNPRWDQVFDIWLTEQTVDVLALVYDEDMIGADEECGGVWFKLSPDYFDDYQTHELVLSFVPQGKLILRISMEGEKDDIQFWFGKAFRALKRAENDVAGMIVDKMGGYFRQILSRKTLDKLFLRERSFFSSFSRSTKHVDPTLQDCEDSIIPLLDYLERNLEILNDNLSESNMQSIVLRIWKEILLALEGVLLPPLSEQLSDLKPLDDYEFHVVYKWLELLKILFNGGEDADAVPLDKLENSQYYALLAINAAYNMETEELIQGYNHVVKNQAEIKLRGGRKADRSRSVYKSKNTVKKKPVKKSVSIELPNADTILRILRMRKDKQVRDFLHTEFQKRNYPTPAEATPADKISQDAKEIAPVVSEPPTNDLTPVNENTLPLR
ncbi:hypothetical protein G6F56_002153 [Rhizopus delemar]|uniref:C2 domain-containing protein n=1 Tax=Rhizopus stolonifer TaxID=4846 RepID=A0A367KY65_RHIST|nr:hypothetical protein G6F56_002153 [Rhizopus delemar]RCI07077.1 hypothetical protein CU098_012514 [Rhizopus stolonifer]